MELKGWISLLPLSNPTGSFYFKEGASLQEMPNAAFILLSAEKLQCKKNENKTIIAGTGVCRIRLAKQGMFTVSITQHSLGSQHKPTPVASQPGTKNSRYVNTALTRPWPCLSPRAPGLLLAPKDPGHFILTSPPASCTSPRPMLNRDCEETRALGRRVESLVIHYNTHYANVQLRVSR